MKRIFYRLTSVLDFFGTFAFIEFVGSHQDILYALIGGKVIAVVAFAMWTAMLAINLTGVYTNNVETFDVLELIDEAKGSIRKIIKAVIYMADVYTNPMLVPTKDKGTIRNVLIVYYCFKLFVCFEFYREAYIPSISL